MAERSEKFYVCDCCGQERITPVRGGERGPVQYSAIISEDVGVAGGAVIKWSDLCQTCHAELARATSELRRFQKSAREARREATP